MKYKIYFLPTFGICVFLMIFGQVWMYLGEYPEAFPYGSVVYKIIATLSFIATNLAIGTAAAIIFYYISLFREAQKRYLEYLTLRRQLISIFEQQRSFLSNFHEMFRKIDLINYITYEENVPPFISAIKELKKPDNKKIFLANLDEYTKKTSIDIRLESHFKILQIYFNRIDEEKLYFKRSEDLISNIINGLILTERTLGLDDKKNLSYHLSLEYDSFVHSTVMCYEELNKFIDCIQKKKIYTFLKMVY